MLRRLGLPLATLGLTATAWAGDQKAGAPPAPPAAAPEVDQLYAGFLGKWKCDTTIPAGAMGPGSREAKTHAAVVIKKDFGGHWYRGTYTIKKSSAFPAFQGEFMLGYARATKEALLISFDDTGAATWETAAGASAGKITFVGDALMAGGKVKVREVLGIQSPTEVFHTMEIDMGSGFQLAGKDECKR